MSDRAARAPPAPSKLPEGAPVHLLHLHLAFRPTMLSISRVSLRYPGGVHALNDVSLETGAGLFGLLGPNGAGKSSLMRVLATLQVPDSGRIIFDGQDVLAHPSAHRGVLGYLPQDFGAYPGVSARALLDHIASLKGIRPSARRRAEVEDRLRQVNLWEERQRAVHSFSGGMRQRFGIAQALLGTPKLIIVDEPTAGLDPEERNRFLNLLSEIGERTVVILSTHIAEDVRQLCTAMAIMRRGRVIQSGAPGTLVQALHGKVWRRAATGMEIEALTRTTKVLASQLAGGRQWVRVLSDSMPADGFEAVAPDLEDVYFASLMEHDA